MNTRGNTPHLSSFTSQTWKKAHAAIGRSDLRWRLFGHTYVAIRIATRRSPQGNPRGVRPLVIQDDDGRVQPPIRVVERKDGRRNDGAMYLAALTSPAPKVTRIA